MARISTSDAQHNPVINRRSRELLSDDLPVRDVPDLDTDAGSGPEVIVASAEALQSNYAAELAFGEDVLTIVLHRGRETYSPEYEQFGVNGTIIWVPVDTPTKVKRKYVEVMARSMPMSIKTTSGEDTSDALTYNRVTRSVTANFSFSVQHDPSPRGAEWLAKVRRET